MKQYIPSEIDQIRADEASKLLDKIREANQQINGNQWTGAMMKWIVSAYEDSEIPYEIFKSDIHSALEMYKY